MSYLFVGLAHVNGICLCVCACVCVVAHDVKADCYICVKTWMINNKEMVIGIIFTEATNIAAAFSISIDIWYDLR